MAPGLNKADDEANPWPTLGNPFSISRKRVFEKVTDSEQHKPLEHGFNGPKHYKVDSFQNQSKDVERARKATKIVYDIAQIHQLGCRSQTLEQADATSSSDNFCEQRSSGTEDLTEIIMTLARSDNVELRASTEMQIRHEIESRTEVLETRLRVSELTISRLRAKLAESEQPQGPRRD